jgi:subtilisin
MRKIISGSVIAAISLLMFACHDDSNESSTLQTTVDDCITASTSRNGNAIAGRYIIAFENSPSTNGRTSSAIVFSQHRVSSDKVIDNIDGKYSSYVLTISSEEAMDLKKDPAVAYVEPDRVISLCSCFSVIEPRSVTWNADKVGYGDGTGKTAWLIDTGIDLDHPDLNVDKNRSRSFIDNETSAEDLNGHGTHVAGVIGALNNRTGTLGVASGALLVALKVLDDDGEGMLSTALKALSYVRANAKAGDVVNVSLGLQEISEILENEIQSIAERGIYFSIAAGNDGKRADEFSPAHTSGQNIYTVTAVDSLDRFASFSNYGNDVIDFAAPGIRVLSTYKNGKYAIMSGTSMASPHVAGLLLINNGKVNTSGHAINDPDGVPDPLAHK